jgi:hypothetical protein
MSFQHGQRLTGVHIPKQHCSPNVSTNGELTIRRDGYRPDWIGMVIENSQQPPAVDIPQSHRPIRTRTGD